MLLLLQVTVYWLDPFRYVDPIDFVNSLSLNHNEQQVCVISQY